MRALTLLAAVALVAAAPQQPPAPEKVEIPGTPLSFQAAALPGIPGKLAPFKIGVKEVTWAEFNAFFEGKDLAAGVDAVTRPTRAISYFGQVGVPSHFLEPQRPVTNVRFHSVVSSCDWLSKKTGGYWRLPTEAEWDYAARGGETGEAPASLEDVGWHKGNSQARTHDGAEKKPNAFGLYDTMGNLWEYVLEFQSGTEFAPQLKGGCWSSPAEQLKFASKTGVPQSWFEEDPNRPRSVWWLTNKDVSQGFRVV
jgi:formylglycine-generating enzyme required for sulfatase activity